MKAYFLLILRLFLGAVFLFSGGAKITNIAAFASTLRDFGYLPDGIVLFASVALPTTEIIAGILLVLGWRTRVSSLIIMLLLALFIVIVIPNVVVGDVIPCGCFGPLLEHSTDVSLLVQDGILLILAFVLSLSDDHIVSLDGALRRRKSAVPRSTISNKTVDGNGSPPPPADP